MQVREACLLNSGLKFFFKEIFSKVQSTVCLTDILHHAYGLSWLSITCLCQEFCSSETQVFNFSVFTTEYHRCVVHGTILK